MSWEEFESYFGGFTDEEITLILAYAQEIQRRCEDR